MTTQFGIVITNFNGEHELVDTLESLTRLNTPPAEVILVDDGSRDRSTQVAQEILPSVRIVSMGSNTARLNVVRNAGLSVAGTRFVFLMDNDIIVSQDCIDVLMRAIHELDRAAICTPRLLVTTDPNQIYTDGSQLHYLCQSIMRNRGTTATIDGILENTAGGGIVLIDLDKAKKVGLFNENFRMGWGDDSELYHRLTLRGYKCYHVPQAICYHLPKDRTTQRAFAQVFNRWLLILETYSTRTIVFLTPAFLVYEGLLFLFLILKGVPGDYLRANLEVMRNLPTILQRRRLVQTTRQVADKDILVVGDFFVAQALINSPMLRLALRLVNRFFSAYWRFIKNLL